jgi:nickel-dependent lactate racemase
MIFFSHGAADKEFSPDEVRQALYAALDQLGVKKRVLAVPPDFTRYHSQAGPITEMVWNYYGNRLTDVLPALGTHLPMTDEEIHTMFGNVPRNLFRVHDWRNGLATLGEVPASFVKEVSEGTIDYSIPIQVDVLLAGGGHDLDSFHRPDCPARSDRNGGIQQEYLLGAG